MRFSLSRRILCLDWDSRYLRMVLASGAGRGAIALQDAHAAVIPPSLNLEDPAALGAFILQKLKRYNLSARRVAVDIPRERAVINALTLPPTPIDELPATVRFQALKELPFPVDEAVIDFAVTRRESRTVITEVMLVAVRKEVLERVRDTCAAAGLTPVHIGLRPYSNAFSVVAAHQPGEKRVLLVDVGPSLTEIDVIRGHSLIFSRSAHVAIPPLGGQVMIGEDSRVSAKRELDEIAASDDARDEAVDLLGVEIQRTIQAYRATEPSASIDEIVIAGGTGIESQLLTSVGAKFGAKCVLYNPAGALGVSDQEAVKLRSFSAPLGLAWGLGGDAQLEVDFLAPKKPVPPQVTLKRRLRLGGLAAALVAVLGVYWGVTAYASRAARLKTLEQSNVALTEQVKELLQIANAVEEVEEWSGKAVWLSELLKISQEVAAPGEQLRVSSVTFDERGKPVIKVMCTTSEVATEFVSKLSQRPGFRASSGKTTILAAGEDEHYKCKVDVTIDVLDVQRHRAEAKQRYEKRRERLKKI